MKKCVIITTINKPTKAVHEFIETGYDVIIVGDKKTPADFHELNCTFLDLEFQRQLFPGFYELLPFNSYARKNIGYLYAINSGYDIIAESDDDTSPLPAWGKVDVNKPLGIVKPEFPNIYNLYTRGHIWPRGYPLDKVNACKKIELGTINNPDIHIIQGLVNGDPDVDAVFRLTSEQYGEPIIFENGNNYVLDKGVLSPFNTQNTIWVNKKAFTWLYLPMSTSFRYTDILKSYIAQYGIWSQGGHLAFTGATAYQDRNGHNLLSDFESEIPVYSNFYKVIEALEKVNFTGKCDDLFSVYEFLYQSEIVSINELECVKGWINILKSQEIALKIIPSS